MNNEAALYAEAQKIAKDVGDKWMIDHPKEKTDDPDCNWSTTAYCLYRRALQKICWDFNIDMRKMRD